MNEEVEVEVEEVEQSTEQKSTELVVRSFGAIVEHKSYGGKSLVENLHNADLAAKKVQYTERIWDRSRSQFMIKNLTCSQADDWTRLRQISAEMCRKRQALSEAKFGFMETQVKIKMKRRKILEEEDDLKRELLEIQVNKLDNSGAEVLVKVEGALKEIETLSTMHDALKDRMGDITEEEFEKAQVKSHIKRAMTQATREVRENGIIKCGNQEYLEQVGVCVSSAKREIDKYLVQESSTGIANTSLLHSFVNDFADRYEPVAAQQADFLGFDLDADSNLTFTPQLPEGNNGSKPDTESTDSS